MLRVSEASVQERRRHTVIMGGVTVAFLVLASSLYMLQIQHHDDLARRSRQNAMRTVPIEAVRGRILDRLGRIIVGNRPAYTLGVIPAEVDDPAALDSLLSAAVALPRGLVEERIGGRHRRLHRPVDLRRDASFANIAYLEEHRHDLPSVLYMVESRRRYPYNELGAHYLGYVREARESQLVALRGEGYVAGDLIGQSGIEAEFQEHLRGVEGEEYQEVTVRGQIIQSARREPERGSDVRLSIDLHLQLAAEAAMDTIKRGALVALDPRNGEILAMVSRPTFDPAVFSFVVPQSTWQRLNDNVERPMFNRATMGTYPPGSTAKMLTALAALDSGMIQPDTELGACTGTMWYGDRMFSCWFGRGHGVLNVTQAIERSCNIFFYQLGRELRIDRWATTARKYGLGSRPGLDLPAQDAGLVASTEVYTRKFGRFGWRAGEALNVAIGQGITLVTPLQMARYVSGLATGALPTPHLAAGFIQSDGVELLPDVPPPVPIDVRPDHLELIREAMVLVTEGMHGTARRSRVPGFRVAGKTGTAENPHGDDHSWYVGYVPADDPQIAVAVIAENAGHGSDIAAPIAGRVFRRWMLRSRPPVPKTPSNGANVSERERP